MSGGMGNFAISSPAQNLKGFQLLASVVQAAPAATLTTGTFPARRFLKLEISAEPFAGNENLCIQFNGDTAAHYSTRMSYNNGAESTAINEAFGRLATSASTLRYYGVVDINNQTSPATAKRCIVAGSTGGTAGDTPNSYAGRIAWANTTDAITSIQITSSTGAQNIVADSRIDVYGAD